MLSLREQYVGSTTSALTDTVGRLLESSWYVRCTLISLKHLTRLTIDNLFLGILNDCNFKFGEHIEPYPAKADLRPLSLMPSFRSIVCTLYVVRFSSAVAH